jgi:hypothetical protein
MHAAMMVFDCHSRQLNHNVNSLAGESRDRLANGTKLAPREQLYLDQMDE